MLSLTLLGQTVLSKNGMPLTQFRSQKEAALLIYLAQTGKAHRRDFLAELLWESSSTKQSLTNLRTTLTRLRKIVGDVLVVTRDSLALKPENRQQVDSVNLLQTVKNIGQINSDEKAATLKKALDTYQGDFLADFHLSNTSGFEEWMMATREHIRRQVIIAYKKLGQYALSSNDLENGIAVAHRWLQVDALDETAHTLLIQLLLAAGNEHEALAQYTHVVNLLKTELNVEPPAEMMALLQNARPKPTSMTQSTPVRRHNLPAAYDQFFGRKNTQHEIHTRLDQPWCRLVTISGQGGVGKTRLATNIAHSRLSQYQDGVWLVELENIDPNDEDLAEAIAVEIATILDLRLTGSAAPAEQLLNHLQHKQMMLVLDNFEHLLAGRQIVLDIVQRCEQVQLIITSREVLRIKAEWTIALTGLSYPTSDMDEMPSDAVELFAARRAQQQVEAISTDELAAIVTICRMVEGMPLAIELAAALTSRATCRAVANLLQAGFNVLAASLHDVPDRHRGLHIVFEMSWRSLTPALQQRLARLAVFRSGFTEAAAQQIVAANRQYLPALRDKSLLTFNDATNRYALHPVIQAYAAEKRSANDPTLQKHAHYFLTLLAQHTEPLQKERPQDSMSMLEPDIDNIRRAWQTGLAQHNAELLYDSLTSLSIYYQLHGLAREGEAIMHTTLRTAKAWGSEGIALATRAGLERARFQNRLGQYRPAMQTIKAALKLADQGNDRWAEGMAHVWWGESLWRLGEYDTAVNKLQHALTIAKDIDAIFIVGWCHHQLGIIHDIQSRFDAAHHHLEQACAAWQALNDANKLSVSLNSIGLVYRHQGEFSAAKQAMEQALAICIEQNNRYLHAMLLNNLSIIYINQEDYFGAQYYLQLGLELATASGSLHSQSDIYTNIGKIFRLQGEIDLAIQNIERGLKIAETIGNRPTLAVAFYNLADVKRTQGDVQGAETVYSQALEITQQDGLKSLECDVLISLAELLSKHNSVKAQQYSRRVVTLAKDINDPNLIKRAEAINQSISH
jgi:predicted ATPase/DNA-binding SARP family transcriptional activator/predicted negative regulator of RcsB-dependent stress response